MAQLCHANVLSLHITSLCNLRCIGIRNLSFYMVKYVCPTFASSSFCKELQHPGQYIFLKTKTYQFPADCQDCKSFKTARIFQGIAIVFSRSYKTRANCCTTRITSRSSSCRQLYSRVDSVYCSASGETSFLYRLE